MSFSEEIKKIIDSLNDLSDSQYIRAYSDIVNYSNENADNIKIQNKILKHLNTVIDFDLAKVLAKNKKSEYPAKDMRFDIRHILRGPRPKLLYEKTRALVKKAAPVSSSKKKPDSRQNRRDELKNKVVKSSSSANVGITLKDIATRLGIKNISKLKKDELIDAIIEKERELRENPNPRAEYRDDDAKKPVYPKKTSSSPKKTDTPPARRSRALDKDELNSMVRTSSKGAPDLIGIAKKLGMTGYSKLKKDELIQAILKAQKLGKKSEPESPEPKTSMKAKLNDIKDAMESRIVASKRKSKFLSREDLENMNLARGSSGKPLTILQYIKDKNLEIKIFGKKKAQVIDEILKAQGNADPDTAPFEDVDVGEPVDKEEKTRKVAKTLKSELDKIKKMLYDNGIKDHSRITNGKQAEESYMNLKQNGKCSEDYECPTDTICNMETNPGICFPKKAEQKYEKMRKGQIYASSSVLKQLREMDEDEDSKQDYNCGPNLKYSDIPLDRTKLNEMFSRKKLTLNDKVRDELARELYCQSEKYNKTCSEENPDCGDDMACDISSNPGICVDKGAASMESRWLKSSDGKQYVGTTKAIQALRKKLNIDRYVAPLEGEKYYGRRQKALADSRVQKYNISQEVLDRLNPKEIQALLDGLDIQERRNRSRSVVSRDSPESVRTRMTGGEKRIELKYEDEFLSPNHRFPSAPKLMSRATAERAAKISPVITVDWKKPPSPRSLSSLNPPSPRKTATVTAMAEIDQVDEMKKIRDARTAKFSGSTSKPTSSRLTTEDIDTMSRVPTRNKGKISLETVKEMAKLISEDSEEERKQEREKRDDFVRYHDPNEEKENEKEDENSDEEPSSRIDRKDLDQFLTDTLGNQKGKIEEFRTIQNAVLTCLGLTSY